MSLWKSFSVRKKSNQQGNIFKVDFFGSEYHRDMEKVAGALDDLRDLRLYCVMGTEVLCILCGRLEPFGVISLPPATKLQLPSYWVRLGHNCTGVLNPYP